VKKEKTLIIEFTFNYIAEDPDKSNGMREYLSNSSEMPNRYGSARQ
jgi:hypothetical protein